MLQYVIRCRKYDQPWTTLTTLHDPHDAEKMLISWHNNTMLDAECEIKIFIEELFASRENHRK